MSRALEKRDERKQTVVRPANCDVYREQDKVILKLDMPGVSRDQLDVHIENNRLIVHGRRSERKENGTFLVREIRQGDFHQEYTLDDTIDQDRTAATVKQGQVIIELQVKQSVLPRKISIS